MELLDGKTTKILFVRLSPDTELIEMEILVRKCLILVMLILVDDLLGSVFQNPNLQRLFFNVIDPLLTNQLCRKYISLNDNVFIGDVYSYFLAIFQYVRLEYRTRTLRRIEVVRLPHKHLLRLSSWITLIPAVHKINYVRTNFLIQFLFEKMDKVGK